MRGFLTRRAWVIARNDLLQLRRSGDFLLPLAVVALLFFLVLPAMLFTTITGIENQDLVNQLGDVVNVLPEKVQQDVRGDTEQDRLAYALAVYLFTPLVIIVPLTVSSAIGSHSVVGERERASGEFLAHSPASEREIFTGKFLSALLPGYFTVAVGFGIYSLIVNLVIGPRVGGWFFPTPSWWFLIVWVVPAFLAAVVAIIVRISARVSSAAAAQQLAALVTLPLVVFAYALTTSSLFRSRGFALLLGAIAWIAAVLVLMRGARALRRERLFGVAGG